MPSEILPEEIHQQIQTVFRATPTVLIGSGFSCSYGLPSMWSLGEHLAINVGPKLEDSDAVFLWAYAIEEVKSDLEKGLNNIANGAKGRESLIKIVREETARLISEKTCIAESKILASVSPENHAPARLLKRLFEGAPQNTDCIPIITTNYDTIIELFCDIANLPVDTGFSGFRHRWARKNPVFETHYRRSMATNNRGTTTYNHSPCLTIKLLKPHGSINWHSTPIGPVEVLHTYSSGPQSIVIPGPSKYEDSLVNTLFDGVRSEMNSAFNKARAFVAIGFGFNDDHLQGIIESRLSAHMPTVIITRDFTDNTKLLLKRFPHIIAICKYDEGSACHCNGKIYYSSEKIWQLSDFLQHFLE